VRFANWKNEPVRRARTGLPTELNLHFAIVTWIRDPNCIRKYMIITTPLVKRHPLGAGLWTSLSSQFAMIPITSDRNVWQTYLPSLTVIRQPYPRLLGFRLQLAGSTGASCGAVILIVSR
jgi:hypothetical protein